MGDDFQGVDGGAAGILDRSRELLVLRVRHWRREEGHVEQDLVHVPERLPGDIGSRQHGKQLRFHMEEIPDMREGLLVDGGLEVLLAFAVVVSSVETLLAEVRYRSSLPAIS